MPPQLQAKAFAFSSARWLVAPARFWPTKWASVSVAACCFVCFRSAADEWKRTEMNGRFVVLGKTLQAITLLWTCLKQGTSALGGTPIAKRALIVVPTSLTRNWYCSICFIFLVLKPSNCKFDIFISIRAKEIKKWLGAERLRPLVIVDDDKATIADKLRTFKNTHGASVLIISYEQFKIHQVI